MAQREKQATATKDATKLKFVRRAIESASEYNVFLNRQRRIERPVYMDLQTDTVNYPVGLGRQNKTLTRTSKIGRFPVAVMPSQYQDWFIEYTSQELQFLPVDTVLKGPLMSIDKLPPVLTTPDVSDFDSDSGSSCLSADECSSCCSCCAEDELADHNASTTNANSNKKSHGDTNDTDPDTNGRPTDGHSLSQGHHHHNQSATGASTTAASRASSTAI